MKKRKNGQCKTLSEIEIESKTGIHTLVERRKSVKTYMIHTLVVK